MNDDALIFLSALARCLPGDERMITCGFRGDPSHVGPEAWRPRPWYTDNPLVFVPKDNAYVTVASFRRAPDESYRRRQSTFAAGRALMIDDVGTKVKSLPAHARPSAVVETSPGNRQFWFFLSKPETDQERFDGLIRAFINQRLLSNDPGMSGVTRVGRLPGFTNGKPQHDGWICKLIDLNEKRYSITGLCRLFDLKIEGRAPPARSIPKDIALSRVRNFDTVYEFLKSHGLLKRYHPDLSGWTEMTCPWVDEHTGAADTGAAVREPAPESAFTGAFRCHHGHCVDKGWRDLSEWVADHAIERLDDINARASVSLAAMRGRKQM